MGQRPLTAVYSLAGLVAAALTLSACAATVAPTQGALIAGEAPRAAAAPQRTVTLTGLRTTDHVKGTLRATGRLTPAPPTGSRIALQRWSPATDSWEEIGHAKSSGVDATVTAAQPGSVRTFRLAIGSQSSYAAAASVGKAHAHYVWRGIFQRPVLATGGKGRPRFTVVPVAEGPRRAEAELLADRAGHVWGDIDTTGCSWARTWLGNLTDGTVRASLLNGPKVLGSVDQKQETETWLNRRLLGSTRTRLQVTDLKSGYGPQVAVDATLLCTN